MREIFKMGGILALITILAAGALSKVYMLTRDKIDQVERQREENARRAALPGAAVFKPDSASDGFRFYRGWADSSAAGEPVGFVVQALGKGYSSTISTMVGLDRQMKITGIKVAFQQATPGLGTRIEEVKKGDTEPWFQKQFRGKTIENLVVVRAHDPERIEAITGATISSKAVALSVREAIGKLEKAAQ